MRDSLSDKTPDRKGIIILKLYIIDGAPNSIRAIANIQAIRRKYLGEQCEMEIIDVSEKPYVALDAGIIVTPTLIKLSPLPIINIFGDLSHTDLVLHALGVERTCNE